MNYRHDNFTVFMESKVREIINCVVGKTAVLSAGKTQDVYLVRSRRGKFIWKILLSDGNSSKNIFVKAIKPERKNLSEIKLYDKNPSCLHSFYPIVYGVIKKYGFYWVFLEGLRQLSSVNISFEDFKKPIEFMASLHAKFYSDSSISRNEYINWVPRFKRQWQRDINTFKLMARLRKYAPFFKMMGVCERDVILLKSAVRNSGKTFKPLLNAPHSLIHGCFEIHHLYAVLEDNELDNMRLIDWANISFAPVTLDLIYLIEKSVDWIKSDAMDISRFRQECLQHYCSVMKHYGVEIELDKFQKLYNLSFAFKIITRFIFEEFKKMKKGKSSNYNFYRDQLFKLNESLNLTG